MKEKVMSLEDKKEQKKEFKLFGSYCQKKVKIQKFSKKEMEEFEKLNKELGIMKISLDDKKNPQITALKL